MQSVRFTAFDYNSNDSFTSSVYEMSGSEEEGWKIFRNTELYLELGKGYRLLKTTLCGICSTDLDRRFLPFALPQIIGHEVLASDYRTGQKYVLEINDTVASRGEPEDAFSQRGMPTHSPTRLVLGIDRLPGGFGPYILAPIGTLVETGSLSDKEAVLIEPFAASMHAVEVSLRNRKNLPRKIAVLGPRRLGSLVIAALDLYRRQMNLSYEISSVLRHKELLDLSFQMGADQSYYFPELGQKINSSGIVLSRTEKKESKIDWSECENYFDLVFDTSGSISGLETSLFLTKKEIHRKTTNGQASMGIIHLTEMVVDEISIAPLQKEFPDLAWGILPSSQTWIFISADVKLNLEEQSWMDLYNKKEGFHFFTGTPEEAESFLKSDSFTGDLPHFDFAIVSGSSQIDSVLRPSDKKETSLVRPRGFIFIPESGGLDSNEFVRWIAAGGTLSSSRCGNFRKTCSALESEPGFMKTVSETLIRSEYDSENLPQAYAEARKPENIKVIVRHRAS